MNEPVLYFSLIYALVAAFMIARPWLSRKNVLFGTVFGSGEIRKNHEAKRIIGWFVVLSAVLAIVPAVMYLLMFSYGLWNDAEATGFFTMTLFAQILLQLIPYIAANRAAKSLKQTIPDPNLVQDKITVDLGAAAEMNKKPVAAGWFLLLIVPVAVTAALAAFYYPSMPDPVATHFNAAGAADAWQAKSIGIVMFPVTVQIIVAAIAYIIGIFMRNASPAVKGSPGAAPEYSAFRRFLTYWMIGFIIIVQFNFLPIILLYAGVVESIGGWVVFFLVLIAASIALLLGAFFKMRRRGPEGAVYDDDSRWKAGMFYFNPSDPSVFVEKRSGIGQTLNFGHPAAWIFIAGIAAIIIFSLVWSIG